MKWEFHLFSSVLNRFLLIGKLHKYIVFGSDRFLHLRRLMRSIRLMSMNFGATYHMLKVGLEVIPRTGHFTQCLDLFRK